MMHLDLCLGLFVYFGWLDPIFFLYVSSLRWPDGFKAMDCAEISGAVGSTAEAGSDWTDGADWADWGRVFQYNIHLGNRFSEYMILGNYGNIILL